MGGGVDTVAQAYVRGGSQLRGCSLSGPKVESTHDGAPFRCHVWVHVGVQMWKIPSQGRQISPAGNALPVRSGWQCNQLYGRALGSLRSSEEQQPRVGSGSDRGREQGREPRKTDCGSDG